MIRKRVVLKVTAGFDLQKTAESSISLLMQLWDFQTVKPCAAFSCFRERKITQCNIYIKYSPFCTLMSSPSKLVLHSSNSSHSVTGRAHLHVTPLYLSGCSQRQQVLYSAGGTCTLRHYASLWTGGQICWAQWGIKK